MKHAALHKTGEYVNVLEAMLLKTEQLPDPDLQRGLYPFSTIRMMNSHYFTEFQQLPASQDICVQSVADLVHSTVNYERRHGDHHRRIAQIIAILGTRLYDHSNQLPVPSFSLGKTDEISVHRFQTRAIVGFSEQVGTGIRAQTAALVIVEIKSEDLSRYSPVYLIHPWIDFLLDWQSVGNTGGQQE